GRALGRAGDGTGDVQQGRAGRAARQHERVQLGQIGVELVAPALQPGDVPVVDAQRRPRGVGVDRVAQVGSDVEQVVLHLRQHLAYRWREVAEGQGDTDRRVALLHVGVRRDPRVGLGYALAVAEGGGPVVTGARVDPGQVH